MKKLTLLTVIITTMIIAGCNKDEIQPTQETLPVYDEQNTPAISWDQLPEKYKNAQELPQNGLKSAEPLYPICCFGGNGGNEFSFIPPEGGKIAGIGIKAGRKIDKLWVFYVDNSGRYYFYSTGGKGGESHFFQFATDEYIKNISGRTEHHVIRLKFTTNKKIFSVGGKRGDKFTTNLQINEQILGFKGKSGRLIDQIGFYVYSR